MTELKGRLIFQNQTRLTIISQFLASDSFGGTFLNILSLTAMNIQGFTFLASTRWVANSLIEMAILGVASNYASSSASPAWIEPIIHN